MSTKYLRKFSVEEIRFGNACWRVWQKGVDFGRPAAWDRMWLEIASHAATGLWAPEE